MVRNIREDWERFFDVYTEKLISSNDYDVAENLRLKKEHSFRVAKLSQTIAQKIELDPKECQLAYMIGLLHDIGRFSQYEKYGTFDDDKSEDHALLSVEVIKEQGFWADFTEQEKEIALSAISDHNKQKTTLKDKQALMFCKILRDADKLDIWDIIVSSMKRDGSFTNPALCFNLPNIQSISEDVIKSVVSGKTMDRAKLNTSNDVKLYVMSMVFDLNFRASFLLLNEMQYIKKIYDTLPKRDDVIEAYRKIRLFIENKFVEKLIV